MLELDTYFLLNHFMADSCSHVSFLDAPSHLYKRVCPSVRPSGTPSLRRLLGASYAEYSALFFSGVVEDDERASIKNSGDVGGVTNHRDYGSNVNSALLGSPVSEATNDTLEGLHLNNGYQVVRSRDLSDHGFLTA